jgi:hypothetical protein
MISAYLQQGIRRTDGAKLMSTDMLFIGDDLILSDCMECGTRSFPARTEATS